MIEPKHVRKFFAHHLGASLPKRDQVLVKCVFHDDARPSLSINLQDGVWKCQAGCGEGGLIDFEMKKSGCDAHTAKRNIATIVGVDLFGSGSEQPEAVYQYRDALGVLVFEKLRLPGKHFILRRPVGKGFANGLTGIAQKPLYNLPDVITANVAVICEGEKDCDSVTRAFAELPEDLTKDARIAVTTNFDGAGKWGDFYNPYFAGKKVIVIPDNDQVGAAHAQLVARAVHPYAAGVKIVNLPGLAEKQDVSDYLENHTAQDLLSEIAKATSWYPPKVTQELIPVASVFRSAVLPKIDWLVQDVIQRGSNGTFTASPKVGKSWAALDLAIAMALGEPWLGFAIPAPVRVAFISREDNPRLTSWRLEQLFRGRSAAHPGFIDNLRINSRAQSPQLLIDNDAQLSELIDAMKLAKTEFCFFDVLNILHCADENDNSEMAAVMQKFSKVQEEVGCGIGLIHHYGKDATRSMTQRLRGASSIAGWMEWLIGISMANEATKTRRMEFELKSAEPPAPILYRMVTTGDTTRLELEGAAPQANYLDEMFKPPQSQDELFEAGGTEVA